VALKKVRELIISKDPSLLDNFLEEVISFLGDPSSDVKQFVIGFLEESCLQDAKCIIQVVPHIPILLDDRDAHFLKRVIRCSMQLYKITIKYVAGLSK
uniref:hypothetical protein n=1 Tax=Salmonella sp. s51228 TaxID=3159652 RepID=UPI00397F6707